MTEYPRQYGMDRIFIRVSREGKYMNLCFSDLTEDEQNAFLNTLTNSGLKRMCLELARSLRAFPEYAVKLEKEAKNKAMKVSLQDPTPAKSTMPFGYNQDGTRNEKEAEVVRFVFTKQYEYFFKLPQELIDEAYAWAKEEGMTLNDEEAEDMARARLPAYIAREVQEKFPDVKYRKAAPPRGTYPSGLKYPSRPLKGEEIIDRDLYAQVREILAFG